VTASKRIISHRVTARALPRSFRGFAHAATRENQDDRALRRYDDAGEIEDLTGADDDNDATNDGVDR
jgi:hypothetical protein